MITVEQASQIKKLADTKVFNQGYAYSRFIHDMDNTEWDARVETSDLVFHNYLSETLNSQEEYSLSQAEYELINTLVDEWIKLTKEWRDAELTDPATSGDAAMAKEGPANALWGYINSITFNPENPQG